jgi:hypothetical protein
MPNVTEEEVHEAADIIDKGGEKPGPRPVYKLLGRGSFSTISRHLETWSPKEEPVVGEPCPEAILDLLKRTGAQIWTNAYLAASQAVEADKPKLEQAIADLKESLRERSADLKAAVDENVELIANLERLTQENAALHSQRATLEGQILGMREMLTARRKPGPKPKRIVDAEPTAAEASVQAS